MTAIGERAWPCDPEIEHEGCVQRAGPPLKQPDGTSLEGSALKIAHPLLRDPEPCAQLALGPSSLPTELAQNPDDSPPFHGPMMPVPPYRPLTRRLPVGAVRGQRFPSDSAPHRCDR